MNQLKTELSDRIKQLDIIEEIDEPTDWVSSLVIVEKSGWKTSYLFGSASDLSKLIKRGNYPMSIAETVMSKCWTRSISQSLMRQTVTGKLKLTRRVQSS